MNYKDELLNYIHQTKIDGIKHFQEEGHPTEALEKAYDLTFQILLKRFDNELKHYNNKEEKAYDKFIAAKNLDYLRFYIEECFLLDKKVSEINFYKTVRKHMRDLLNNVYIDIMKLT